MKLPPLTDRCLWRGVPYSGFGSAARSRGLLVALLVVLSAGQCLFAGKEFLAGPGEQVVPNQLIVGLQLGADINQIIASLVPQAAASLVSSHWNTHLLNLPPGIQTSVSRPRAPPALGQYVEPTRIHHTGVVPPKAPMITQEWNLTSLRAVQAWSYLPD